MKKIKCNEQIPKECNSTWVFDKAGNAVKIAGEICEVECICDKCGRFFR